ncbi:MAG TPA: hypothetical protein VD962_05715 [Rubricoccaceae bacterium]|nr:hypothetical protein [Rubricoccaceae bacterium]
MDPIPTETHAAEIEATIQELEGGLALFPLSKAVNRIDDWRREILNSDRPELRPIAEELRRLHKLLTGEALDGVEIGRTLARLGAMTQTAATTAPDALQKPLKRLGSLLAHAGHALAGNNGDGA